MAKRISQSSVNWVALAERVPAEQKVSMTGFKIKSDTYLRRVLANPEEAPKINWAAYKNTIPIPGMVDTFMKKYEALKVPYPVDTLSSKVDAQWAEVKKSIEAFVSESNANIAKYQKQIEETKSLLPFDKMTMEDVRDAYPDQIIDPLNKPTFWPHTPDEQEGYVDPDRQTQASH